MWEKLSSRQKFHGRKVLPGPEVTNKLKRELRQTEIMKNS